MKLKKFGFLRHHKKIKIEGIDQSKIINKCIDNNILIKDFKWENQLESTAFIKEENYDELKKLVGNSYRFTVLREGGIMPILDKLKAGKLSVVGAFLMGALIFYQGLFVAEIQVYGYRETAEEDLRQTMMDAGLYEGAKKPDDYSGIKAALYENHDTVTWVGVYEKGRLVKVTVAETDKMSLKENGGIDSNYNELSQNTPVNIVASKSGMIESIIPLQGDAMVEKGEYVNEGDVLINGEFQYQSTDYSMGDDVLSMYSHADGKVLARTPRKIEFYTEKNERTLQNTGKFVPGIYIKIGDLQIDSAGNWHKFKVAERKEAEIINTVKPLPIKLSLVKINQVRIVENKVSGKDINKRIEAALRQYEKDRFSVDEGIVTKTIELIETENLIKASIFAEIVEDIGVEKKIHIKNKEKDKEKSGQ